MAGAAIWVSQKLNDNLVKGVKNRQPVHVNQSGINRLNPIRTSLFLQSFKCQKVLRQFCLDANVSIYPSLCSVTVHSVIIEN